MIEDLHKDVLVVPLSTMKGAGHNPGQVIESLYGPKHLASSTRILHCPVIYPNFRSF